MVKFTRLRFEISTFTDNFNSPDDVEAVSSAYYFHGAFTVYRILPDVDHSGADGFCLCIQQAAIPTP
jgi:hypothetical protein